MPAGSKCSFKDCENERSSSELSLFRFPAHDDNRCRHWVERSGNDELKRLSSQQLRSRVVCAAHFHKSDLFPPHRLGSSAIPLYYYETQQENSVNYSSFKYYEPEINLLVGYPGKPLTPKLPLNEHSYHLDIKYKPSTPAPKSIKTANAVTQTTPSRQFQKNTDESVKKLKTIIRKQNYRLKKQSMQIKELKRKIKMMEKTSANVIVSLSKLPEKPRIFLEMQINRVDFVKKEYNKKERELAVQLYYKSPSLYKSMLEDGYKLPNERTCKRWLLGGNSLKPGSKEGPSKLNINVENIQNSVKKVTDNENETVIIVFDEMCIEQSVDYDSTKNLEEGSEDTESLGINDKLSTHMLVFS